MLVRHRLTSIFNFVVITATLASFANASPAKVGHWDAPNHCDPLFIPIQVDEIGDAAIFPPDEALFHDILGDGFPVCTPTNLDNEADPVVLIINDTGRDQKEVWYVADRETDITNYDGFADGLSLTMAENEAFRIDHKRSNPTGIHHPLIFESIAFDGVWQAGEEWHFILQDYHNTLGISPNAITSIGVGSASMDLADFVGSSGSIITVPEPTTLAILGAMIIPLCVCRRWNT